MKASEVIQNKFLDEIKVDWGWDKLTEKERQTFLSHIGLESYIPRGTKKQKMRTYINYYQFFLLGTQMSSRKKEII